MKMYVEGVVVSVGYADLLDYTLPYSMRCLDRVVVVTHESDRETLKVCKIGRAHV